MRLKKYFFPTVNFCLLFCCLVITSAAQNKWTQQDDGCGATRWANSPNGAFNLEIKEQTIESAPKALSIDTLVNGGIRIRGWERNEIAVRSCIQAWGQDETEAKARTSTIKVELINGLLRASIPPDSTYGFGVSYDISLPRNTNLQLKSNNGGLRIANINGTIEFNINNGGAILESTVGDVRGTTNNGGISFIPTVSVLKNNLDFHTNNGQILISIPEDYSACFQAKAPRGSFQINLPAEKIQSDKDSFSFSLGSGGGLIKAESRNGSIVINRRQTTAVKENTK